jgi:hypothetical protein
MTRDEYQAEEDQEACIEACYRCAIACDYCAASCLSEPQVAHMAECIRADLDCAAICRLAAEYMARDSVFAADICEICIEVCERCAGICEQHDEDHCQVCAEACRECAAACRKMS